MKESKSLLSRILEAAAAFALSAFLLKLGVSYLLQIWWILLIVIAIIGAAVVIYRILKYRNW